MKKKLFSIAGAGLFIVIVAVSTFVYIKHSTESNTLFSANIEALADIEPGQTTVLEFVCKHIGCCGGERKCFTGSINVYGISVEGTFYLD